MDACVGVEREVVKVLDKFTNLRDQNVRSIDELLLIVKNAREELQNVSTVAGLNDPAIIAAQASSDVPVNEGNDPNSPVHGPGHSGQAPLTVSQLNPSQIVMLMQASHTVRESTQKIASDHRDLHSSVSKVGKAVDRNFVSDYDSTSRDDIFTSSAQANMLNQVILQHFYRQGQLEIAETLAKEANLSEELKLSKEPFQELNSILESLQKRDLSPALAWATAHRDELHARGSAIPMLVAQHLSNQQATSAIDVDDEQPLSSQGQLGNNNILPPNIQMAVEEHQAQQVIASLTGTPPVPLPPISITNVAPPGIPNGSVSIPPPPSASISSNTSSSLEMKLHRLQFVEILKQGRGHNRLEAIQYARQHFPRFVNGHEKDIATLMGALMYAGPRLEDSPYAHLLDNRLWQEIADLFVRDACALMGLSVESPLTVAVNAGCTALPALLNIKQVMLQHAGVWGAKDELPIEIDLGPNSRYHSIFACPILRQQTSDHNPPLRLTCGHCISRDALNKLSSGHKLKCPYCPVEQNPADARQIVF